MFYNPYSIYNYGMHIIRSNVGNSELYGSIFQTICIGNNTYTGPRIDKRANVTPIQGSVINNDINFYHKRYQLKSIPQILDDNINNDITIKAYFYPRIVDPSILKLLPEGKYKPIFLQ